LASMVFLTAMFAARWLGMLQRREQAKAAANPGTEGAQ
jgi:hypothetical protein